MRLSLTLFTRLAWAFSLVIVCYNAAGTCSPKWRCHWLSGNALYKTMPNVHIAITSSNYKIACLRYLLSMLEPFHSMRLGSPFEK